MRFLALIFLLGSVGLFAPLQATLTATFTSGNQTVVKQVAHPALLVKAGEPPVAGLPAGPFKVTFQGSLNIPKRYRAFFSIETDGETLLKIKGEDIPFTDGKSKRLRLNQGEVPLEISFTSQESGAGHFRLYWEEKRTFPREPIPASAFTSAAPTDRINPAHIVTSHNCLQCHAPGDLGKSAMPELTDLKSSGPDLTHIGDRVHEEWLVRWIAQPEKLKPTTTMPAMVDHTKPEGAQAAADLAAYLATLTNNKPAKREIDLTLSQKGGEHFHNLGCVACHSMPNADEPDYENNRIPLNNVAAKFKNGSLIPFLKNPAQHHPGIKMPNFGLTEVEATTLAAYLTEASTGEHTPDPSEFPPGDAARGKTLAVSLNCASCHTGLPAGESHGPKLADLAKLPSWQEKGCLGPDEKRGKSPRLILTAEEKKAVTPNVLPELRHDTLSAYAHRQIDSLNCASCHAYHGETSLLAKTHQESKKLLAHIKAPDQSVIQFRPHLTHMGRMLHTPFLEKMLKGTEDPRPRPWLDMRMPAFPLHAEKLALGLARHHGLDSSTPNQTPPAADQVEIGKTLVTNYACIGCHGINDQKPQAFEVQAINFGMTHGRLRTGYYHQWMANPARLVPETKMPDYPAFPGVLDDDEQKQFEAIRAYIQSVWKK